MRLFLRIVLAVMIPAFAGCATIVPPRGVRPVERILEVTGYCKCGDCCGWHRTWLGTPVYSSGPLKGKRKAVGITATGERARHGTIAADTAKYPFGTVMYVEGYGYGRVEDVGGGVRGNLVDVYFNSHRQAEKWGRKKMRVTVWFPKR